MRVRRVLVAMDGSSESSLALWSAARLAGSLAAELAGLFVEDVELLRLAGLPFAREASVSSGVFRRIETSDIERRFRVAAERAREALGQAALASGLRTSFRVTRGRVVSEILHAAPEADVVAAGKRSGHGPAGRRLGATARSLIAHLTVPILVGGRRDVPAGPVVVLSAAPEVPPDGLRLAGLLANAFGAPEVVVAAGGSGSVGAEVLGIPVRRRRFSSIASGGVQALPELAVASAVVLIRPEGAAAHERIVALAESVVCPVFVIGPRGLAELLSA